MMREPGDFVLGVCMVLCVLGLVIASLVGYEQSRENFEHMSHCLLQNAVAVYATDGNWYCVREVK